MIIANILLFYVPLTALVLVMIFIAIVGSEFDSCIEKLQKELPQDKPTTCYTSWDIPRIVRLAEKERPDIYERMKYLRRLGFKSVAVFFGCGILFAICAITLENIKAEPEGGLYGENAQSSTSTVIRTESHP